MTLINKSAAQKSSVSDWLFGSVLSVKSVVNCSVPPLHINDVRAVPQRAGQAARFARGQDHVVVLRHGKRVKKLGIAAIGLDGGEVAQKIRQMQAAIVTGASIREINVFRIEMACQ